METVQKTRRRSGIDIERRLGRLLASSLYQVVMLLLVAAIAVISIAEIAARESALAMLTVQITTLNSELLEQNKDKNSKVTAAVFVGPPFAVDSRLGLATDVRIRVLNDTIRSLERLRRRLQELIAVGGDDAGFSLWDIEKQSNESFAKYRGEQSAGQVVSVTHVVPLFWLSSDYLLAIAVMACAVIGAMVSALRGERKASLRGFSLGLASGFAVYLAIKGGKHIFLLQTQGEGGFNPYGIGFAGLLCGLFSDRLHQTLSLIAEDSLSRFHAALGRKERREKITPERTD